MTKKLKGGLLYSRINYINKSIVMYLVMSCTRATAVDYMLAAVVQSIEV